MKRSLLNLLTVLSLLLCVAVAALWIGYLYLDANRVIYMEIVFPDGFRGTAVVRFTERDGVYVKPDGDQYTFRIPESGELNVRNDNPQFRSRRESARYRNGQPIPIAYLTDERTIPQDDVIAVWPLLFEGDDAGFFVGTRRERNDLQQKRQEKAGAGDKFD
jgi:hypothetical protein